MGNVLVPIIFGIYNDFQGNKGLIKQEHFFRFWAFVKSFGTITVFRNPKKYFSNKDYSRKSLDR
jgi:hypothetical protein